MKKLEPKIVQDNLEIDLQLQYLENLNDMGISAFIKRQDGTIVTNERFEKEIADFIDPASIEHDAQIRVGEFYYTARIKPIKNTDSQIVLLINDPNPDSTVVSFLQRSSIAVVILDHNFNVLMFNSAAARIVPFVTGANFLDILDPEDQEKARILTTARKERKIIGPIEIHFKKYDKTILLHINTILSKDSQCLVFTMIDATKYKTIEMSLLHSQKMQAIGQLSGAIAHDFNNLLTAMIGFCDLLLLKHSQGDGSFSELMQIKQNANRAANLVRQLLAFARKQVLQPNIISITNVMEDISTLISRLVGENITVKISCAEDVAFIRADQGQLEQVIINLVVNARDAMYSGGTLTISARNIKVDPSFDENQCYAPVGDDQVAPGDYVLIEVSDTGTGIPRDIISKIFEPFFSTKDQFSGTGLGLATVFGIVKQTGGYIRLKTAENTGSSFMIFLKQARPEDKINLEISDNNDAKDILDSEDQSLSKDLSIKGKILLVEDETPVRSFAALALINKGYDILEADCSETALKILEEDGENIALVMTDVMMPGQTGTQMAEEIQKTYPDMKFIFVSGYAEDSLSYLSNASCHFLAKPFNLKQLATKVKEVLSS